MKALSESLTGKNLAIWGASHQGFTLAATTCLGEKAEVYYRTQIAYGFSIAKCTETPYDQHYDENNFYNKKGYREVMENFSRGEKLL